VVASGGCPLTATSHPAWPSEWSNGNAGPPPNGTSGMPFVAGMVGLGGMDKDGAMLGHLGINVPDLEAARRYYRELLPLVGFEPFVDDEDQFAFVPAEGKRGTSLFFYPTRSPEPYSRHDTTGLQHLAFTVPTRSAVHAVHKWARGTGCTVLHEPRQFPEYPPPYFATFWLDPFGMMLEAVCHHDRD
jgi:catechol 2,3-dioxygenase-like lactoylglutathione lyase family enzyme